MGTTILAPTDLSEAGQGSDSPVFPTILVATDLSEASDGVLRCLHTLKPLGVRTVFLTHALGIKHLDAMKYWLAEYAEPHLARQKALLEEQGFETNLVIAPGLAPFEVNRVAKEREASLIVVGSHGFTLAKQMLIGGTATAILHHAEVPVLVFRLKITDEAARPRCDVICRDLRQNILYCTDFSDTAERAFACVEKFVTSGARRVTLLHVQDSVRIEKHLSHRLEEFNEIDRARLQRLEVRLMQLGAAEVRIEIPYGLPSQEILRCATEEVYSALVMGSQGRGTIGDLLLGSVSHRVVRGATMPVLLVPPWR